MDIARRAHGTLVVLRTLPGQRRVPFLPRERVLELRDARVRAIVAYAAENVPYYRALFRREHLDAREFRSADDLVQLPTIDRATVQQDAERFRSTAREGREAIALRTSGSTGVPLTIYHDPESLLANIAYAERERAVEAQLVGRRFRYERLSVLARTSLVRTVREVYANTTFRPFRPRVHTVWLDEPLDRLATALETIRPAVLTAYGSYLELFFGTMAARGRQLALPRVVTYTSDMLSEQTCRFIETELGCAVTSAYNAVEAFKIGFFCEERRGFHLHEDLCHVVLDGGEIVLSNLVNRGTVLLNYRIGDLAELSPEACPCGRTSPLLSTLQGRVNQVVRLPDGEILHPLLVAGVVKSFSGVARYQLVQHEPDRFELKVVPTDPRAFAGTGDELLFRVRKLVRGCSVELTLHDELEPGARGKFSPVLALAPTDRR